MSGPEFLAYTVWIIGTAGLYGVASYWLIGWLLGTATQALQAPHIDPGEPDGSAAGRVAGGAADLFSLCDAGARRRGLLRWP